MSRELVYKGRLYKAVAGEFDKVVGGRHSRVILDLPDSDHKLYVVRGPNACGELSC